MIVCFRKWLYICHKLNYYMEVFFEKFASLVTNNYRVFLVASFVLSAGLAAGFFRFNQLHQSAKLYFPEKSTSWDELKKTEAPFNGYIGFFDFIITKANGGNVIEDDILKFALEVHNDIKMVSVKKSDKNETLDLSSFCIKKSGKSDKCVFISVLSLFGFNMSEIINSSVKLKFFYDNKNILLENGRNLQMSSYQLFGNLNIVENSLVAEAVRFVYPVEFAKTDTIYKRNKVIEKELHEKFKVHRSSAKKNGLLLDYRTERSNDDAIDENSSKISLVVIAITIMVALCSALTLNFKRPVKGHLILSLFGVLSVALGIGAAFGLVMLIGEPYVAFVGVLPFLVLAVGVDDMFIIIDEVDAMDSTIVANERLVNAIKHVGASITMTSLTDLIAFAVTANSDLSSVRYFCVYAALSIAFTYLMVLTFFVSCFVLDIKRTERNKCDIIPCITANMKAESPWNDTNQSIGEKVMETYAYYLMKTPTKILVTIIYLGLVCSAGYAASKVNVGFDQKEVAAEGSHELSWYVTIEKYFPNILWTSNVIMQDEKFNYANESSLQLFTDLNRYIHESKYFKSQTFNWLSEFKNWLESNNKTFPIKNFNEEVRLFLLSHRFFVVDVNFSEGPEIFLKVGRGVITASRVVLIAENDPLWQFHQSGMNSLRTYLKTVNRENNVDFTAVSLSWIFLELLNLVITDVTKNLCICAGIIMIITLPYLWDPIISFLMLFMFGSISVMLIAIMYLWNVDLSGVTLIIIIMSIGFAVDYMAHIAHTYVLSQKDTAEERMIFALKTMGKSVLKGGVSTFVGILVTAFSKSKLFQIFFKMMFGIVGLGLVHGIVFLPVFLTMFARRKLNISGEMIVSTDVVLSNNSIVNNSNDVAQEISATFSESDSGREITSTSYEGESMEHSSVILNKNSIELKEKSKGD